MRTIRKLASSRYALLAAFLIAAFIFTCRGLVPGNMGVEDHGAHKTQETHAICCFIEDSGATAVLHSQFQSALPSAYVLLLAFAFAVSFLYIRVQAAAPSPPYAGMLERRYGGTRLVCKYAELFSQGILNPKTF